MRLYIVTATRLRDGYAVAFAGATDFDSAYQSLRDFKK